METMLRQLLEGQKELKEQIGGIQGQIGSMQGQIGNLQEQFSGMQGQIGGMQGQIGDLQIQVGNMQGQLDENTQVIKALLHRTDELDAKYDCLLHTTATKDSIASLDSKFDLLNHRLFQTENKINLLSTAI